MYAVIKTGGKQYKVAKGDSVFVEKLEVKPGDEVTFDEVILVNDGKSTKIGTPVVEGAKVVAKVEKQGKGKKIHVFKYKAKSNYHRNIGHRQPYTCLTITSINVK